MDRVIDVEAVDGRDDPRDGLRVRHARQRARRPTGRAHAHRRHAGRQLQAPRRPDDHGRGRPRASGEPAAGSAIAPTASQRGPIQGSIQGSVDSTPAATAGPVGQLDVPPPRRRLCEHARRRGGARHRPVAADALEARVRGCQVRLRERSRAAPRGSRASRSAARRQPDLRQRGRRQVARARRRARRRRHPRRRRPPPRGTRRPRAPRQIAATADTEGGSRLMTPIRRSAPSVTPTPPSPPRARDGRPRTARRTRAAAPRPARRASPRSPRRSR